MARDLLMLSPRLMLMLMLSTDTTDTDHMAMVMDTALMDMDTHTDTDTTERDPLMPSPRLMLSTDTLTLHTPMLHTDTDMVWELLLTPVLPPPSSPSPDCTELSSNSNLF